MNQVRLGFVGCGGHSTRSLQPNIPQIEEIDFVAAAELDEARASQSARRYGVKPYTDFKEMIAAENLDVDIPSAVWSNVTNEVTLAFWTYGHDDLYDTTSCSWISTGSQENHIWHPHDNDNTFWDVPDGQDRINKVLAEGTFEGNWNHWAFTKDKVAGEMRIYLNGNEWVSGSGKTLSLGTCTQMLRGSTTLTT